MTEIRSSGSLNLIDKQVIHIIGMPSSMVPWFDLRPFADQPSVRLNYERTDHLRLEINMTPNDARELARYLQDAADWVGGISSKL